MIDFDEYLKNKMKDKNWKIGFGKEYRKLKYKYDLIELLKEKGVKKNDENNRNK